MGKYLIHTPAIQRTVPLLLVFIFVISLFVSLASQPVPKTDALNGSQFRPGRIIDDAIFYNKNSMNASQIQNFLNSKVPVCDTNGTQPYGSTTRAAYGTSKGYGPPYTCLRNYRQNTSSIAPESGLCNGYSGKSNESAATIIYKVAQSCGISPKVLLVMLQKEQSLVTDDWPWSIQYQKAMGAFCPDTAPCDPGYAGFFKQVYYGAHRFKVYAANPGSFNYRAGRNNTVLWHPNSACGTSNFFIENQATANLYIYTPYRPNSAALNNLYGTGNSCSSYGNRNFWRLFNDWFGSTLYYPYAATITSVQAYNDEARTEPLNGVPGSIKSGRTLYFTVNALNTGGLTWSRTKVRLGTGDPFNRKSAFCDDSWLNCSRPSQLVQSTVVPGASGTFHFAMQAPDVDGDFSERFYLLAEGIEWMRNGANFTVNLSVQNAFNARIESIETFADAGMTQRIGNTMVTSGTTYWKVRARNIGSQTWSQAYTRIGTRTPNDRASVFSNGSWIVNSRPTATDEPSIPPGQTGTFTFSMTAPSTPGIHTESFGIVADGQTDGWMPLPLFGSHIRVAAHGDKVLTGEELRTGSDVRLGSRRLVFQGDGNLVLYNASNKATWHSRTSGKGGTKLIFQSDGNWVMYTNSYKVIWQSKTNGKHGNRIILQGDGNLVMYSSSGRAAWHTRTAGK